MAALYPHLWGRTDDWHNGRQGAYCPYRHGGEPLNAPMALQHQQLSPPAWGTGIPMAETDAFDIVSTDVGVNRSLRLPERSRPNYPQRREGVPNLL